MAEGCCSEQTPAAKSPCPACGRPGSRVEQRTLLHQLRFPDNRQLPQTTFYFCANPACDWVYFDGAAQHYTQAQLRRAVGQKSTNPERLICYCFDISARQIQEEQQQGLTTSRDFVVQETQSGACACAITNPSGRCCLKDFPA